ncbi:MAG TPA: hypothetical protein VF572_00320 [Candidatus Saccharimonadales bacterium]|jgi:uncharacterized membrane protein
MFNGFAWLGQDCAGGQCDTGGFGDELILVLLMPFILAGGVLLVIFLLARRARKARDRDMKKSSRKLPIVILSLAVFVLVGTATYGWIGFLFFKGGVPY